MSVSGLCWSSVSSDMAILLMSAEDLRIFFEDFNEKLPIASDFTNQTFHPLFDKIIHLMKNLGRENDLKSYQK